MKTSKSNKKITFFREHQETETILFYIQKHTLTYFVISSILNEAIFLLN